VDDLQRLMVGELIDRAVRVRVVRHGRLEDVELTPVELST
jgi:hypothetical protein